MTVKFNRHDWPRATCRSHKTHSTAPSFYGSPPSSPPSLQQPSAAAGHHRVVCCLLLLRAGVSRPTTSSQIIYSACNWPGRHVRPFAFSQNQPSLCVEALAGERLLVRWATISLLFFASVALGFVLGAHRVHLLFCGIVESPLCFTCCGILRGGSKPLELDLNCDTPAIRSGLFKCGSSGDLNLGAFGRGGPGVSSGGT